MAIRFDRTLDELSTLLGASLEAERAARAPGFLQRRDPRAKILVAVVLLLAAGLAHRPLTLVMLYAITFVAAAASRLSVARLLRREWLIAGVFTGVVALPAIFVAITPGRVLLPLPHGFSVSAPGVEAAIRLLLRAVVSIHLVLTLTQSTPWARVLGGLRGLGIPSTAVMVLSMCHRYIYLLVSEAREMILGREARRVGTISGALARRQLAASAGTLLLRAQEKGGAVHAAMVSRGYRGDDRSLDAPRFAPADAALVIASFLLAAVLLGADRHAF